MRPLVVLHRVLAAAPFSSRAAFGANRLGAFPKLMGSSAPVTLQRRFCSHFTEDTAIDQVKKLWQEKFAGSMGRDQWEAMSEDEQRDWFEGQLALIQNDSERTPGLIDVQAEWQAISSGTHAPTEAAGYRALVEAAVAAERPDLALDFAIHLMQSNLGASTPIDTWNVMLYIMPGEEARRLLDVLALSPAVQPDVHSFTAVISTLGDEGRIDQAIQLLADMKAAGHTPNGMTYNGVILDACYEGRLDEAIETLAAMEADGMNPLIETLQAIVGVAAELGNHKAEAEHRSKLEALELSKQEILDRDPNEPEK